MRCKSCGSKVADEATICPKCGFELQVEPEDGQPTLEDLIAQGEYGAYASGDTFGEPMGGSADPEEFGGRRPRQARQSRRSKPANPDYFSLGGWVAVTLVLWVFAACYQLVTVFNGIGYISYYFTYGLGLFGTVYLVGAIIVLAGMAASAWMLWKRMDIFLFIYQIVEIFSAVLEIVLVVLLAVSFLGEYMTAGDFISYIVQALVPIAAMFLWTLYFTKSERAQVYMSGTEYLDRALLRFPVSWRMAEGR